MLNELLDGITPKEAYWATHFNSTVEDEGTFSLPDGMKKRLVELGLIEHRGGGYYWQTDLMLEAKDRLEVVAEAF
jgi:hypothetical protein